MVSNWVKEDSQQRPTREQRCENFLTQATAMIKMFRQAITYTLGTHEEIKCLSKVTESHSKEMEKYKEKLHANGITEKCKC